MKLNKMHTGLIIAAIMGLTSVSAFAATSNYDGISSKLAPVEAGTLKTSGEDLDMSSSEGKTQLNKVVTPSK